MEVELSQRILLSDRHFHDLRLSEQEIGLIIDTLHQSFDPFDESGCSKLVQAVENRMRELLDQPVSASTVPEDEEREWRKVLDEIQSDTYRV